MARRINQKSVYTDPDVEKAVEEFVNRYPKVSFTDLVNAALSEYLAIALKSGVDANLKPLNSHKK
jgi:hypothetical protein